MTACGRIATYLALATLVPFLVAQDDKSSDKPDGKPGNRGLFELPLEDQIKWQRGPTTGDLGNQAQIKLPKGYAFADADGTRKLMEAFHNPLTDEEVGLITPEDSDWFAVFEFEDSGYVKDDDRDKLDADALIKSLREGNELANKERKSKGWDTLEIIGWKQPPRYSPETNQLEWATHIRGGKGEAVNYNTRRLGRSGVMRIVLVCNTERLNSAQKELASLLKSYDFTPGHRYAEFRSGDKIAKYGLTALITGGAAAVALKTGLLQKFWKIIAFGVLAVLAFFRKIFARLFGRRDATTP